jgi:hypothetical protein
MLRQVARVGQRPERSEQRVRQFRPAAPLPRGTLRGLENLWLSLRAFGHDEQGDIVLVLRWEHIAGVGTEVYRTNEKTGFLLHLANRALLDGLSKLQMSTRKSPSSSPMRTGTLTEQDEAITQHDDSNADLRFAMLHGCQLTRIESWKHTSLHVRPLKT